MTRNLGDMPEEERQRIISEIQTDAAASGWPNLNNQQRGQKYREWEARHDLTHTAVKDQIMKGYDAAQHVPPSGEAAIHEKIKEILAASAVPFWQDKYPLGERRAFADFVIGFSPEWVVITAELESVVNWEVGLQQALRYRTSYFIETGLLPLAALVLFGDCSSERWEEVTRSCSLLNVLLLTFDLNIDGVLANYSLDALLDLRLPSVGT